jgi:aspartyl protease
MISLARRIWIAGIVATLAGVASPAHAAAPPESLFVWGHFNAADSGFAATLRANPKDTLALIRRGTLALWSNHLPQARAFLDQAAKAGATKKRVAALTAESYERENDFAHAAPAFREAGRETLAMQLESLRGKQPYQIRGADRSLVPFEQTDPLPVVKLTVNGKGPFFFLIDTGAAELVIDPELADSLGVRRFGTEGGTFGGGKKANYTRGVIDSVRLGAFVVSNVPTVSLDTKRMSMAAGGRRVGGILGTHLLSRFRSTLDYPASQLVLERRGLPATELDPEVIQVPFWMAGDHYMLARGHLEQGPEVTWFIDTGLAGGALAVTPSAMAEAGIALPEGASFDGVGGGGSIKVTPFGVKSLSVGGASGTNYMGFYGVFPASLERGFGTRIAGLVSHGFFRQYRLTFDFDRMQMVLAKE